MLDTIFNYPNEYYLSENKMSAEQMVMSMDIYQIMKVRIYGFRIKEHLNRLLNDGDDNPLKKAVVTDDLKLISKNLTKVNQAYKICMS